MKTTVTRRFRAWSVGAVLALAALAPMTQAQPSPSDGPRDADAPINSACPVTTDEEVDPRFTVEYEGKTIGFCCRKCQTKFEKDPGAYVANLPVLFQQSMTGSDEQDDAPQPEEAEQAHKDEPAPASSSHEHGDTAGPHSDANEDHEHHHAHDTAGRSKLAVWIGKLHPPATHLPIGLLIGAAVAELGLIVTGKPAFRHAAGFCLAFAAFGAVIAATLGWFNGGFVLWDADWVQATHRWLGTSTAGLSLVTLAFFARAAHIGAPSRAVFSYRVLLFFTASLICITGFFGGALVYGINHYAW